MKVTKNHYVSFALGGFFFCLDQYFKYLAHTFPSIRAYLLDPWLGWEYLANPGIAFSVPFPNALLIIGTPLILIGLLAYMGQKKDRTLSHIYGTLLIFFGAISNLIDRIVYGITIDYIRILTTVMNLADIMIIIGTFLLLFGGSSTKKEEILTT